MIMSTAHALENERKRIQMIHTIVFVNILLKLMDDQIGQGRGDY
tara:strand:- start:964 stop:1095 length:132 start_codon:yes stop_codon:yes gene_type:complete